MNQAEHHSVEVIFNDPFYNVDTRKIPIFSWAKNYVTFIEYSKNLQPLKRQMGLLIAKQSINYPKY
jgi:hypothetical protein